MSTIWSWSFCSEINSLFIDASNLYLSFYDIFLSYFECVLAFLLLAALFMMQCLSMNKEDDIDHLFLFNLRKINAVLNDNVLLIFHAILIIFYALNSNYWSDNTFISLFSLYNFYSDSFGVNVCLYLLILAFNVIMIQKVVQLNFNKYSYDDNLLNDRRVRIDSMHSLNKNGYIELDSLREDRFAFSTRCAHKMSFCVYIVLYVLVMLLVLSYGLFSLLPSNNVFGLNSYYTLKAMTVCLSFVLSMNKGLLIPNMINSLFAIFGIHRKHRNDVIMLLRTIVVVIIPLISSFLFLNECGNGWFVRFIANIWHKLPDTLEHVFFFDFFF